MGDFNINLMMSDSDAITSDFLQLQLSFSLSPLISSPTRVTRNTKTLIDQIFTNDFDNNICSGVCVCDISDHLPIFAVFKHFQRKPIDKEFIRRDINERNICQFGYFLQNYNWNIDKQDPNEMFNDLYKKFMYMYNLCFPVIKTKVKCKKVNKPWFTRDIQKNM